MSINGFIDIDSTYRDRNTWPKSGEFEINISQSGTKQKGYALDPVCLSEPVVVWSCNALTTSRPSTYQLTGQIVHPGIYGNIGYSTSNTVLPVVFNNEYNNSAQ